MKLVVRLLPVLAGCMTLACVTGGIAFGVHAAGTQVMPVVSATQVPTRDDVRLVPLAASDSHLKISAEDAVAAAERQFGLSDSRLDYGVGVAPALASIRGDQAHENVPAWVVTADLPTYSTAISGASIYYAKLAIIVNSETGKYVWAYPTSPAPLPGSGANVGHWVFTSG